ncbi:MAG: hypothetical protein ACREVR_18180 [Burkholderiales bacterium]
MLVLYAALCVVALWFIPASVHGWLGVEPDPLAGVFAMLLALPWTRLLRLVPDAGPWPSAALLAAGMAMNVWLLWRLQRWWQRSRASREQ